MYDALCKSPYQSLEFSAGYLFRTKIAGVLIYSRRNLTSTTLLLSTNKQHTDNQISEIKRFCKANKLIVNEFVVEVISGTKSPNKRKLGKLMENVQEGDLIICTELSRLGRSLIMIMNVLQHFLEKNVSVWTIKDGYKLGDDIQSKVLAFAFGLSAEIERKLISERTKQGLQRAKEKGVRIGRVKGKKNSYYKLSKYDTYIKKQLLKGRSKLSLAKELGVTWKTLNTHLQRFL